MNKVLIIVGDASETLDTMYPYYRLQEAGFQEVECLEEFEKSVENPTTANNYACFRAKKLG